MLMLFEYKQTKRGHKRSLKYRHYPTNGVNGNSGLKVLSYLF